ncbi:MAG: ABC transporter substrate-binding protein [Peptostreptococcales bacterium]
MKKVLAFLLVVVLCLGLLAGCGAQEDEPAGTIKIAVAGPLTGDFAEYGTGFKNAVELMAEQWNANGGVLGMNIEVVPFDDKNSGEEAASIAERIAGDADILAVVGHFASGVSMAASPTYQEAGIIEISPSASHPDYSKAGDYIFRNNTVIHIEAKEALDLATKVAGAKKIAVMSVKTDWGTSTAAIVKDLLEGYEGVELVAHEEIIDGTVDFSPTVTAFRKAEPDAIVVVGMYNVLAPFATQYKAVDPEVDLIGFSNAYSQELINLGKGFVEGVYLPAIFFHGSEDEDIKTFVDSYVEKYKVVPSSLTAQAYDSMGIILTAIETAESTDKEVIKDTIYTLDYPGVTGDTHFDEQGDAQKTFTWIQVQDGTFVQIPK